MVVALAAIRLALALGLLKKKSSTCIKGKIMELVDFCEVKVHSVFGVCSDFIIWLILDKKKKIISGNVIRNVFLRHFLRTFKFHLFSSFQFSIFSN